MPKSFKIIMLLFCVVLIAMGLHNQASGSLLDSEVASNSVNGTIVKVEDFLIAGDPDYTDIDEYTDAENEAQDTAIHEVSDVEEHQTERQPTADDPRDINRRNLIGRPTAITSFPWQVSLQLDNQHLCSGSIISPNIVITAAHCILKSEPVKRYQVRAGSSFHDRGGVLIRVRRLVAHENYMPKLYSNDVALVQLTFRLKFSGAIRPIRVAKRGDAVPAKRRLLTSGWNYPSTWELQFTALRLLDYEACRKSYSTFVHISKRMFCAGAALGESARCRDDSGGAVISYINGVPKMYGIVSWAVGCAVEGYPGIYTKVSAMRPWINSRVQQWRKRI